MNPLTMAVVAVDCFVMAVSTLKTLEHYAPPTMKDALGGECAASLMLSATLICNGSGFLLWQLGIDPRIL